MSEFHDPDLRQQLGRLSGPYPDDNAAFAAWQRRVGQARRRRAVAWTTGAALSLVIGTVAVAAMQRPTQHSLVPGKSSEASVEFTVSVPETEVEESTIATLAPVTTAATTLAPNTTPSSEVEPESSLPETEGTEAAGAPSNGGTTKNHGGTPTSATPASPSATQTFQSGGGSVSVRQDGERLTIVGINAAAGFQAHENDHSGGKVEVTFRSGDHQFELTVKLVDGVMKPSVSEHTPDSPHQDSAPDTAPGGDHNNGGGDHNGG